MAKVLFQFAGKKMLETFLQNISGPVFIFLLLVSCDSGSVVPVNTIHSDSFNTGSISLQIMWGDGLSSSNNAKRSQATFILNPDKSINCWDSDLEKIFVYVYSQEDNALLADNDTGWDCSLHYSIIDNVPAGKNRKVVVYGKNKNGEVLFHGEQAGITVNAGKECSPVIINAISFDSPVLTLPERFLSILTNESVQLKWETVNGAISYGIIISQNSDLSDPLITDTVKGTIYKPKGLSDDTIYYWSAFAFDSYGNKGMCPESWSFYMSGWSGLTPMPVQVTAFGYAVLGSDIYIIGGDASGTARPYVQKYNTTNDTWEKDTTNGGTLAPLPSPRAFLYCGVINGKIHAIGGWDETGSYQKEHFVYDPEKNKWSMGTSIPEYPIGQFAATLRNKMYVFGGWWGDYYNSVFEYSETDGWMEKTSMPTPRAHGTTAVYNDKIYVIGGSVMEAGSHQPSDVVEVYDPLKDTWTTDFAPIPAGLHYAGSSGSPVSHGKCYIIGPGEAGYSYNTQTDTWEPLLPMPEGANGISAINGTIYAMAGSYNFSRFCENPQYIMVTPFGCDFGSINIGKTAKQTVTIRNWGSGDVEIENLLITGTGISDLEIEGNECTGQILSPGQNCQADVIFLPTKEQTITGNISVLSDDPHMPVLDTGLTAMGCEGCGKTIFSYSFDDMDNQADDNSGNNYNGTIHDAYYAAGEGIHQSNAFLFERSNKDFIEVPYDDSQIVTDVLTLEAWIKPFAWDNLWNRIVSKYDVYRLRGTTGHAEFGINSTKYGQQEVSDTEVLSLKQWHYLVGTFDGQLLKLFVDGKLKRTTTLPEKDILRNTEQPIQISNSFLDEGFTGLIDNVSVYRRLKTQEEIEFTYYSYMH